jgi:hypothetical protein
LDAAGKRDEKMVKCLELRAKIAVIVVGGGVEGSQRVK